MKIPQKRIEEPIRLKLGKAEQQLAKLYEKEDFSPEADMNKAYVNGKIDAYKTALSFVMATYPKKGESK